MARYIDAEMLENEVFTPHNYDINRDDVIALIAEQPIADVVEVVRCKDCKKAIGKHPLLDEKFCVIHECSVPEDYYCASGERKDNDA